MRSNRLFIAPLTAMALSGGVWAQSTAPSVDQQQESAVSREQAEQIALRHVPGQVEEVEEDTWNGEAVWEVTVESEDGEDYEIVINSNTGRIVEVDS